MARDALELQFRELRDQMVKANREIEELKKQLDAAAKEKDDLLKPPCLGLRRHDK